MNIDKRLDERKNEVEIASCPIKEMDINLIIASKSICKITYKNKQGTGFLIQLYKDNKPFYCLITNEHVVNKEMVESKEIININNYNIPMSWMQLKLSERYIKYDTILDIIIIEIKIDADKIKEELFLIPNLEEINLINKEIYIIQYPAGQNLSYSTGNIIDVVNDELVYNASTKEGSSGSAILLKNTTKVIGVHKQGNKLGKKENYGVLISSCIKLLQSKNDEVEIKLINKQKIIYENGDYYIGQALNGKAHGKGILYYFKNYIF